MFGNSNNDLLSQYAGSSDSSESLVDKYAAKDSQSMDSIYSSQASYIDDTNEVTDGFNIRGGNYGNMSIIDKMRGIQANRLNAEGTDVSITEMYSDSSLDTRVANGQYNVTITDIYSQKHLFDAYHGLNTDGKVDENEDYMIETDAFGGAESKSDFVLGTDLDAVEPELLDKVSHGMDEYRSVGESVNGGDFNTNPYGSNQSLGISSAVGNFDKEEQSSPDGFSGMNSSVAGTGGGFAGGAQEQSSLYDKKEKPLKSTISQEVENFDQIDTSSDSSSKPDGFSGMNSSVTGTGGGFDRGANQDLSISQNTSSDNEINISQEVENFDQIDTSSNSSSKPDGFSGINSSVAGTGGGFAGGAQEQSSLYKKEEEGSSFNQADISREVENFDQVEIKSTADELTEMSSSSASSGSGGGFAGGAQEQSSLYKKEEEGGSFNQADISREVENFDQVEIKSTSNEINITADELTEMSSSSASSGSGGGFAGGAQEQSSLYKKEEEGSSFNQADISREVENFDQVEIKSTSNEISSVNTSNINNSQNSKQEESSLYRKDDIGENSFSQMNSNLTEENSVALSSSSGTGEGFAGGSQEKSSLYNKNEEVENYSDHVNISREVESFDQVKGESIVSSVDKNNNMSSNVQNERTFNNNLNLEKDSLLNSLSNPEDSRENLDSEDTLSKYTSKSSLNDSMLSDSMLDKKAGEMSAIKVKSIIEEKDNSIVSRDETPNTSMSVGAVGASMSAGAVGQQQNMSPGERAKMEKEAKNNNERILANQLKDRKQDESISKSQEKISSIQKDVSSMEKKDHNIDALKHGSSKSTFNESMYEAENREEEDRKHSLKEIILEDRAKVESDKVDCGFLCSDEKIEMTEEMKDVMDDGGFEKKGIYFTGENDVIIKEDEFDENKPTLNKKEEVSIDPRLEILGLSVNDNKEDQYKDLKYLKNFLSGDD